jgi:LysR family transcriptional regulator, carnitine catabolism transcriptional activator
MEYSSRQLRAFVMTAQHQSFSRAAEALYITPSGLSVLIRELENQLGFRLFDRTTRHVSLTSPGEQLLSVVRRSISDIDTAISTISQTNRKESLSISVGVGLLLASNMLPQAMAEFYKQRTDVRVKLYDADLNTVLQRVKAGQTDIAFGSFEKSPGVRRMPFFRFSLMAIQADSSLARSRSSIPWSALRHERLILQAPPAPLWHPIDRQLSRTGMSAKEALLLNRLDTIISMVEAGHGTGIIPSIALPLCQYRNVVMTRLTNPTVSLDYYQIRNRGRKLSPAADDFATFLQAYIARWAGRAGVPIAR